MPYVDLNTIHNPATGTVPPVSWGDQIRTNFEFFAQVPQFSLSGSATPLGSGVLDVLNTETEAYDTDTMHTGTNNYVTCNTAGRYSFTASVEWGDSAHTGGNRLLELYKNSTTRLVLLSVASAVTSFDTFFTGSRTVAMSVGDTMQVRARHAAYAGLIDTTVAEFQGRWIGR